MQRQVVMQMRFLNHAKGARVLLPPGVADSLVRNGRARYTDGVPVVSGQPKAEKKKG